MGVILSKRLQKIADMVPRCGCAADIGTDHGYIPVWLLENSVCSTAIAADINEGPLQKAKETAENAGLTSSIIFRLCDGLAAISENETDAVIIAGMGGETIQNILMAAPWSRSKTLVLQPQSKIPELRFWLNQNGYCVTDASLIYDAGRFYVVWKVSGGREDALEINECIVERLLSEKRDPLLPGYIDHLLAKNEAIIKGLQKSASAADSMKEIAEQNAMLLSLREECEKW